MARIFFGLEIPEEVKERLLKVRAAVPGAKWQQAEQLHITLLFLGQVDQERIGVVTESARQIQQESFMLEVVGLDCFGQPQRPKTLWAGVQPGAPVASLHEALMEEQASIGLATESRGFRPHITLARFKRQAGSVEGLLAEHGESVFGQFPVTEFALFDSKPGPTGSVYTVIERFPLQERPHDPERVTGHTE